MIYSAVETSSDELVLWRDDDRQLKDTRHSVPLLKSNSDIQFSQERELEVLRGELKSMKAAHETKNRTGSDNPIISIDLSKQASLVAQAERSAME